MYHLRRSSFTQIGTIESSRGFVRGVDLGAESGRALPSSFLDVLGGGEEDV